MELSSSLVLIFCSVAGFASFCLACVAPASSHKIAKLGISEVFEVLKWRRFSTRSTILAVAALFAQE